MLNTASDLLFEHFMIYSALRYEFIVGAYLHNCPILQDDDEICLLDRIEPMCDHDGRFIRQYFIQGILNELF